MANKKKKKKIHLFIHAISQLSILIAVISTSFAVSQKDQTKN